MNVKKYDKFTNLVADFESFSGNALIFAEKDSANEKSFLSYHEFSEKINSEAKKIHQSKQKIDFIRVNHQPETIIRIFADAVAGCDVVLIDQIVPALAADILKKKLTPVINSTRANDSEEGRFIFFTSGTTSASKAVILSAESLLHAAWRGQCMLPCGPDDVLLSLLPLSHVFGFVCSMLWGLCYNAAIGLSRGMRYMTTDAVFFNATILPVVPRLAEAYIKMNSFNPELKTVLVGAAPLTEAATSYLRSKGYDVYLGYGLTETASGVAISNDLNDPYAMAACPGVELKLTEGGEVLLKTDSMMLGYIDHTQFEKPNLTDGFFSTGDIGYLDEKGKLHLAGRKKDILILPNGTKIFCPEYETKLSKMLNTDEVAVTLKDNRPVLLLPAALDHDATHNIVEEFNDTLQRGQRISSIIYLKDDLPRTVTGKLRRWLIQNALEKGDFTLWKN